MTPTEEWAEVALGDVCTFRYGKSLPAAAREVGSIPVDGSNGAVGSHTSAITHGPTIIVGRKGSFGEVKFSPVACWPIDTTYFVDETSTAAHLPWLAYRLEQFGLKSLNRAAAVPGLNREDAYRLRLLLPPLKEQRRIADILDQADALRAKNVGHDELRLEDCVWVDAPQSAEAKRTRVRPGDVLLSITADLGRTAVVPKTSAPPTSISTSRSSGQIRSCRHTCAHSSLHPPDGPNCSVSIGVHRKPDSTSIMFGRCWCHSHPSRFNRSSRTAPRP